MKVNNPIDAKRTNGHPCVRVEGDHIVAGSDEIKNVFVIDSGVRKPFAIVFAGGCLPPRVLWHAPHPKRFARFWLDGDHRPPLTRHRIESSFDIKWGRAIDVVGGRSEIVAFPPPGNL